MCKSLDKPNEVDVLIGPLHTLEDIFHLSSCNPSKILGHLRIPEQGPERVYWTPPNYHEDYYRNNFPGWTPSRVPCPSPLGSHWLLQDWLHYHTGLPQAPSPDSRIWTSRHPTCVGEANVLSLLELKRFSLSVTQQRFCSDCFEYYWLLKSSKSFNAWMQDVFHFFRFL